MRGLLVLTELFLPTKGGTAVWAAEVYRRLGGREIHIVTAAVPGAEEFDAVHPNTVHRLDLRRVPWLKPESLAMYLRLFLRSLRLVLRHRIEAIHAIRALPEGLVACVIGRLCRIPVVIYAHGEELTGWGRGRKYQAMRAALRRADRIIANSEHTRDLLLAMGMNESRIAVINPGVDIDRFRPGLDGATLRRRTGIRADEFLIFSVGRLSRRKGFDQMVRAVARLRGKGLPVRYVIGGIGEDEAYLDQLINDVRASDGITRLGAIATDELPLWMNTCDLFAMPNRDIDGDTEGFGMVYLEAAACGTPSLAGTAGGTGSAVVHGSTGWRVDGSSVDAICTALEEIIARPQQTRQMADNAYRRAISEFSWDAVAAKTRRLHASLGAGRSGVQASEQSTGS